MVPTFKHLKPLIRMLLEPSTGVCVVLRFACSFTASIGVLLSCSGLVGKEFFIIIIVWWME